MSGPSVTLSPANPKPGDLVTATIVRDIPGQVVGITVTEANGEVGSAQVPVAEPYTIKDTSTVAHVWAPVSDDGTTVKATTTA